MLSTYHTGLLDTGSSTATMDEPSPCLRVLIMTGDDSEAVYLRQMLQISSYGNLMIEIADRISSGAERLRGDEFDVVLMDLELVDTKGLDSFSTLASLAPRIPIVVVVGIEDEPRAKQAVRCGAQDYLIRQQVTPHNLTHSLMCAVERQRRLLELRDLSMTDPLTGLLNRRGFWMLADSHIRMTRRQRMRSLLLSGDIDGLKEINDNYGHGEGDRAISKTAALLKSCFRESDIVARFGGDEFVALAFGIDDFGEVALRHKIGDCLARANEVSGLDYDLSLSIGTTVITGAEESIDELLKKADQDLYIEKAKRTSYRIVEKRHRKTKAKRRRRNSPNHVLAAV